MAIRLPVALCAALYAALSVLPAWAQTEPESAAAPEPATEKVLVVGQKPGPGLWKISRGDHVMWVFGAYSPLPKKMEWRSQEVETIMAQSQQYLLAPAASPDVGILRGLTALPFLYGIRDNPDGAKLQQVLPPEVYRRWQGMKQKYIGDDQGMESLRPIFAADILFRKALERAGLTNSMEVRESIEKLARKNKVKVTPVEIMLPVDSPSRMVRDFKKAQVEDAACLSATMDTLERDIDDARERANAWAKGDLGAISKLNFAEREGACNGAMMNSSFVQKQPGWQEVPQRMRMAWVQAAEHALDANRSTFALLPIHELLNPQGAVAMLAAKGYAVQKPE
ncbi:TraB/GumN family protein [Oxalobacteraceae bacterium A2-2]